MSFDVVNLKRVKWFRSGSYGPEGSLDIVHHSYSTCPGTFGTVKSLDTTKEVWNLSRTRKTINPADFNPPPPSSVSVNNQNTQPLYRLTWSVFLGRGQVSLSVLLPCFSDELATACVPLMLDVVHFCIVLS